MIEIHNGPNGVVTYRVPQALVDVAVEVAGDNDQVGAFFWLARRLVGAHLGALERIVKHQGHDAAVSFARRNLVE
jgi:hypothetical protein